MVRRAPRQKPKPLLQTYGSTRGRRGHVFTTTASAMRRQRARRATATLTVLLLVAGALLAWLWTRPVTVTVGATPLDAVIRLEGSSATTGRLKLEGLKPGPYRVTVSRSGFETRTLTLEARHIRGASAAVRLEPLPQSLKVSTTPRDARIRITREGQVIASSVGSCEETLPAGPVTVEVEAKGCNPYSTKFMLDGPTALPVRLDPEGQVVHGLGTIACAGAPKAVALTPDGREAWTTILNGPPSIEIFDPVSGRLTGEVDLGTHGAVEIVFSRDGSRAYASQMETAKVFEIDTATRKVLRGLDTESAWTKVVSLSPDGATLYAANWSGDDVSEIDLASGKLRRRIAVADTPRGLWPSADGKSLWVASFGVGDLERIDLASGDVETVFDGGGALRHLVADEQRGLLFASDMAKDCVWVTNMKTGGTRKFAKVGHKPNTIDLSPDGRVLFVSNRGENNSVSYYLPGPEWGSILLLDTRTGKPLDGIVGGNQCTALDVSDDGKLLVFSDFLDNRLRVYQIPETPRLLAGGGGRSATLANDVVK